jgi:hypothetical protein
MLEQPNLAAQLQVACAWNAAGRHDLALAGFFEILGQNPGHLVASLAVARLVRGTDRAAEALPLLTSALHQHPNHPDLIAALRTALASTGVTGYAPGHFHSPIPDLGEVRADAGRIFRPATLAGIELQIPAQLRLLDLLRQFFSDIPFTDDATPPYRYFYRNDFYSYGDAGLLFCLLRHVRPQRIVEVGSGYSTCVMLDTNEYFLGSSAQVTCIEPDPPRLLSLCRPSDPGQAFELVPQRVQEVPLDLFRRLERGDVLFVDSSHVSKVGSDVNYLLFEVLPALQKGVLVHFHDVFADFEYPREWILDKGLAWNECYLLRAFLQYNTAFSVTMFLPHLAQRHRHQLEMFPLLLKHPGGGLWLTRV